MTVHLHPPIDFTPAIAGAPMPESAFDFLQNAARFFDDHELAPYSPAWLQMIAGAWARQGRHKAIPTQIAADRLNCQLIELQCRFSDAAVVAILRARAGL